MLEPPLSAELPLVALLLAALLLVALQSIAFPSTPVAALAWRVFIFHASAERLPC